MPRGFNSKNVIGITINMSGGFSICLLECHNTLPNKLKLKLENGLAFFAIWTWHFRFSCFNLWLQMSQKGMGFMSHQLIKKKILSSYDFYKTSLDAHHKTLITSHSTVLSSLPSL